MRVFFLYAGALALFLILCLTALYAFKSNFLYILFFRLFIVIEYSCIALFFALHIKDIKAQNIIKYAIIPFILFSIYDYVINKSSFSFYPQVVECIIYIFVIIYLFYEKMKTDLTTPIYQLPVFWISIGFLIYFSGNFFLFLYSKNSIQNDDFKVLYHIIYGTVTIIKNMLICIGIYLTKFIKQPINPSDEFINLDLDPFNPTAKLKKV